jgi:hypothetical protein
MQCDQICSVVGLRENGDRVVIARDVTHNTAERIKSIMTVGSGFTELFIEPGDDGETPAVDHASAASDDPALAGATQSK